MIELRIVDPPEQAALRAMVESYWEELMPTAAVLKDAASRERYFNECFRWEGDLDRPYFAQPRD